MSLFEWIMEDYNPGPMGGVDFSARERDTRSRGLVLLTFTISAGLLGAALLGMSHIGWIFDGRSASIAVGLSILYLVAGYFIRPAPDTSNLGWFGGLMDNPFRISDDINRLLVWIWLLLFPGRFIAESIAEFGVLITRAGR